MKTGGRASSHMDSDTVTISPSHYSAYLKSVKALCILRLEEREMEAVKPAVCRAFISMAIHTTMGVMSLFRFRFLFGLLFLSVLKQQNTNRKFSQSCSTTTVPLNEAVNDRGNVSENNAL